MIKISDAGQKLPSEKKKLTKVKNEKRHEFLSGDVFLQ